MRPACTVVVPTYNQGQLLRRLLNSFDAMQCSLDYEVLVVDDHSTDETETLLNEWSRASHPYRARFLRQSSNRGPGAARTAGAEAAAAEVVAYTDSDCVITANWLDALLRQLNPDRRIAGVGGRVLALSEGAGAARYMARKGALEPPRLRHFLVTCNCCFLRAPLLEAGAFPADIPKPGGEDIAASIALWKQGWRFAFEPEAIVYHDFRDTLGSFVRTWRNYGLGCGTVAYRMLTKEELYPEIGFYDVDHFWDGRFIRPNVTGLRSYLRALAHEYGICRENSRNLLETMESLFYLSVERLAYLQGWKIGRQSALDALGGHMRSALHENETPT